MYNKCPYFRNVQGDDMQSKNLCIGEVGGGRDLAYGAYNTSLSMPCCQGQQNMPCSRPNFIK